MPAPAAAPAVREPPATVWGALRHVGPGLILSAAIVGSGELIATTALGARAGFSLLWMILLGCTVKVAVQLEYGRAAILHGRPTLQAWNLGQRAGGGLHWSVHLAALFMLVNMAGQGGVIGGAAEVGRYLWPFPGLAGWLLGLALLVGLLAGSGRYQPVEWTATALNAVFLAGVFGCLFALQGTELAIRGRDLGEGLRFHLPEGNWSLALAAFGLTGIASGEITLYPYWCLEKGYARWTGPREDTAAWRARARGWMRVMTVDALLSMLLYTLATCGFYLLGATVLHARGELQDGPALVVQLSAMFTEVLGPGVRWVFMVCALAVLFSTIFANSAGFSRMWADYFGLRGWLDWGEETRRRRTVAVAAWVFPLLAAGCYLGVGKPLLLVVLMGITNALYLAVVGWQTLRFRYLLSPPAMRPSRLYDLALWISLLAIGAMVALAVHNLLGQL
ncbi:MAG: divalent metal cation transporter [Verrucomicrobia bacterium]|nr:MAG: divalent metal cation transporter [Verrucomicrobiota bacterium]